MTIAELINELQGIIDVRGVGATHDDVVAVDGLGAKWTVEGSHPSHTTPGETVLVLARVTD